MQVEIPLDAATLIATARKRAGQNQSDFARQIGSTQPLISKYEKGRVDPPSSIIMHSMHILTKDVSLDELTELVRSKLSGPNKADARRAMATLVSNIGEGG